MGRGSWSARQCQDSQTAQALGDAVFDTKALRSCRHSHIRCRLSCLHVHAGATDLAGIGRPQKSLMAASKGSIPHTWRSLRSAASTTWSPSRMHGSTGSPCAIHLGHLWYDAQSGQDPLVLNGVRRSTPPAPNW
eukprot:342625-Amphidinium_carterae.1